MSENRSPRVPTWVVASGAVFGGVTLLFFMGLVITSLAGYTPNTGARFLVVIVLAFGASLASAFLGGAAAASGHVSLPFATKKPIRFSVAGGIAVLAIFLLLGWWLYIHDPEEQALAQEREARSKLHQLLEQHAKLVVKRLEREIGELRTSKSPASSFGANAESDGIGFPDSSSLAAISGLGELEDQFLQLYSEQLEAVDSGDGVRTHELQEQITYLLNERHRDIFFDAGMAHSKPGIPYRSGYGELRVRAKTLVSVAPWLNNFYPGEIPNKLLPLANRLGITEAHSSGSQR